MRRSCGHIIPINLDPPPCRLKEIEESSLTHDPTKQQQTSRFEVVKAPDDLGNGLITDTVIQHSSQQLQQLQLITLLPTSPEPQTPVSIQSTETDEVGLTDPLIYFNINIFIFFIVGCAAKEIYPEKSESV
jgi:hypothetical protein